MDRTLLQQIRQQDYERYLCCLFEASAQQPALFALLALNQELAKTAEAVTEVATGMIRLKWWQEALEEILADKPPREHPVVQAIARFEAAQLRALFPLIEARLQDIEYRKGFLHKQQFENYLQQTAGVLHVELANHLCPDISHYQQTILRAGQFYGLIGVLRAMPYHLERGIVRLPLDVMRQFSISPAAIEQGLEKEAFQHLMAYWMQEIAEQAASLSEDIKALPTELHLIKRLHIVALLYANALKKAGGNPGALPRRLPNLPLKLWWQGKKL